MSENKKNKNKRRVLAVSCIFAALIVAGSTFAWFTSKDEVTNRLSANADYGVAVAENFTPPENWIPGQTIIKEAGATNTGNVDALVRMYLTGNMQVFKEDRIGKALGTPTVAIIERNDLISNLDNSTTGSKYVFLTKLAETDDTDEVYLRQLGKTPVANASSGDALSEVQAIQAGGWLAYAPDECNWVYSTNAVDPGEPGSVTVKATGDSATTNTYANGTYGVAIDSDTFKPVTEGLYIFRRNISVDDTKLAETYEYSGYYYVPSGGNETVTNNPGTGTYYALQTVLSTADANSDLKLNGLGTPADLDHIDSTEVINVKFFTAKIDNLSNSDLFWKYDSGGTFEVTDAASSETVKINIELENLGTNAEQWTAIGATNAATATAGAGEKVKFYYNNDVDSGKTTQNLVKTVQLDEDVTRDAYIAFDFDLNVKLDSVQITKDASGKELTVPVDSATGGVWSSSSTTGGAYVATTGTPVTWDGNEISKITWTSSN